MLDEKKYTSASISDWVEIAKADPETYLERQATEVFLSTIGSLEAYNEHIFLKGGILMGVVYQSPRNTGDIDLSTTIKAELGVADELAAELDKAFPSICAELGYPDLLCAVQSIKTYPKGEAFPKNDGPSIKLKIGYAKQGSPQEKNFLLKKSSTVLEVDISFNEPIGDFQVVIFEGSEQEIHAYSLLSLIAEKFRALLQQEKRNRHRRQDVYDLHSLTSRFSLDDEERARLLDILVEKCTARGITPNRDSLSQKEIIRRAEADWDTLELEVENLPEFSTCFKAANSLYISLPWK